MKVLSTVLKDLRREFNTSLWTSPKMEPKISPETSVAIYIYIYIYTFPTISYPKALEYLRTPLWAPKILHFFFNYCANKGSEFHHTVCTPPPASEICYRVLLLLKRSENLLTVKSITLFDTRVWYSKYERAQPSVLVISHVQLNLWKRNFGYAASVTEGTQFRYLIWRLGKVIEYTSCVPRKVECLTLSLWRFHVDFFEDIAGAFLHLTTACLDGSIKRLQVI